VSDTNILLDVGKYQLKKLIKMLHTHPRERIRKIVKCLVITVRTAIALWQLEHVGTNNTPKS